MDENLYPTSYLQSPILYLLIAFTISLIALHFYIESRRVVKFGRKLPGPTTVPILGNALLTVGVRPEQVLDKIFEYDIYGPVTRAFMGPKLIVFLYHPQDLEIILSSTVHIDKAPEYSYFKPWLGDGLLISTGEKWRSHRKIIAPTFHWNILKTFVPLFYENSRDLVLRLRNYEGKEFDCHDYMSTVTVDILLETAMGIRGAQKYNSGYEYAVAVMKMCDIIHRRQYNMLLRTDFFFKYSNAAKQQEDLLNIIHGLTSSVIRSKKEDVCEQTSSDATTDRNPVQTTKTVKKEEQKTDEAKTDRNKMHYVRDDLDDIEDNDIGEKRRLAFLDMMLELSKNGAKLTDEEIKEEVDTIMFEGHDTTAAGSSFVLCLLGIHQDVQERVYEELYQIFKGTDRPCTFQDTVEMKYLERVILETLRLFPPVPAIARYLQEDVKLATRDDILPKGCTVLLGIFKTHRLEEFYPNAAQFNPDNFLPERMQERNYYAFIPFSAGPRSCVGRKYAMLKLKVLLSTILRNYRVFSDHAEKDFRLRVDIILKRTDGFRIRIKPRNKSN